MVFSECEGRGTIAMKSLNKTGRVANPSPSVTQCYPIVATEFVSSNADSPFPSLLSLFAPVKISEVLL